MGRLVSVSELEADINWQLFYTNKKDIFAQLSCKNSDFSIFKQFKNNDLLLIFSVTN